MTNTNTTELMLDGIIRRIRGLCNDINILTLQTVTQRRMRDTICSDLRAAEHMVNALQDEMRERR